MEKKTINIKVELEIPESCVDSFFEELHEFMDRDGGINTINSLLDDIEQQLLKFIRENDGQGTYLLWIGFHGFREDFESKTKDWTKEYLKKVENEYFKGKHLKQPLRR